MPAVSRAIIDAMEAAAVSGDDEDSSDDDGSRASSRAGSRTGSRAGSGSGGFGGGGVFGGGFGSLTAAPAPALVGAAAAGELLDERLHNLFDAEDGEPGNQESGRS